MNLPIPIFLDGVQDKILKNIKQSFVLRKQTKQLLDAAKFAVEIAIEDDEKKALMWLKSEVGSLD